MSCRRFRSEQCVDICCRQLVLGEGGNMPDSPGRKDWLLNLAEQNAPCQHSADKTLIQSSIYSERSCCVLNILWRLSAKKILQARVSGAPVQ